MPNKQIHITIGTAIALLMVLFSVSCKESANSEIVSNNTRLDSLFYAIFDIRYSNPERALEIIDSIQTTKDLTQNMADECRAEVYDAMGQTRLAAFYAQRSLKDGKLKDEDLPSYLAVYRLLAHIYINSLDWRKALDYATEAYTFASQSNHNLCMVYAPKYLSQIGSCQIMLGREKEGNENFGKAYNVMADLAKKKNDFNTYYNIFATIGNCIECNLMKNNTSEALLWLPRLEESYRQSLEAQNVKEEYSTYARQCLEANTALVYAKSGRKKEAEEHYKAFLRLNGSNESDFLGTQLNYLKTMGRWQELANLSEKLDTARQANGKEMSMDYLRLELAPMFEAELKSHHTERALHMAERIIGALDSVYTKTLNDDASQLAVIYETQEKESMIAAQQTELSHQRTIGMAIALALITLFFIVYTLYRRRVARRMAQMQAAQERIKSELRIARDIQMSMVPHEFPNRPGLDLYAAMTPAKELGGDLYGYQLYDDRLYFCIGDVSGKGVPASLFMAQATRLFSTLAEQGMMPAEICTRINNALSGKDNEQGMFVTLFIGLVDLTTGHLDFCNAGHNPPVIGGGEEHGSFLHMESNAPIGLWPGLEFIGESIDSIRKRPLFIYTDGLNEAENPQHEQFGDDRLLSTIRDTRYESSQQVIEDLMTQVEAHRQGAEPNDDLTMMCLRLS
jgi:serine phosphatase RsbU (regulator of sigma subunit)